MNQPEILRLTPATDTDRLVTLLMDADEDPARIRRLVEAHTGYVMLAGEAVVGAVLMDWQMGESEILYIAVEQGFRGKGYGKAAIAGILAEARQRAVAAVLVGTANAGLDQIAFYQKCGFRMDSVRKDYFNYFAEPIYENGIRLQDMLVFRYRVT